MKLRLFGGIVFFYYAQILNVFDIPNPTLIFVTAIYGYGSAFTFYEVMHGFRLNNVSAFLAFNSVSNDLVQCLLLY